MILGLGFLADGIYSSLVIYNRMAKAFAPKPQRPAIDALDLIANTKVTPLKNPNGKSSVDGRQKCTLSNVGVEISFPGKYESQELNVAGGRLHRSVLHRNQGDGVFSIVYRKAENLDQQPKSLKEAVDSFRDVFLALDFNGTKPSLEKELSITVNGLKGVDLIFRIRDRISWHRIVFVNGRSAKASVVIHSKKRKNPEVNRFLDSIRSVN